MPANFETGHDKNLANLQALVMACTYFGPTYNPANPILKLAALNPLAAAAQTALNDLRNALPVLTSKMGSRRAAFRIAELRLSRILGAHAALSNDEALKEAAKAAVRDFRGERAPGTKKTAEPSENEISNAQTSYIKKASHFAKLVSTLQSDAAYLPNEADLTLAALQALLAELGEANGAVLTAKPPVDNARAARNAIFYTNPDNLVDTALRVKQYVKSVYGVKSDQYKQIGGLKFTRAKQS